MVAAPSYSYDPILTGAAGGLSITVWKVDDLETKILKSPWVRCSGKHTLSADAALWVAAAELPLVYQKSG